MRRILFGLICLALGVGIGWSLAKNERRPQQQPDMRTGIQKRLFMPGVARKVVVDNSRGQGRRGYEVSTDCTGAIYVRWWDNYDLDYEEWLADQEGRLIEHRKSLYDGHFPRKDILSDGAIQQVAYQEVASGIAKDNWEVVIWPARPRQDGFDGARLQDSFDKVIDFLSLSK